MSKRKPEGTRSEISVILLTDIDEDAAEFLTFPLRGTPYTVSEVLLTTKFGAEMFQALSEGKVCLFEPTKCLDLALDDQVEDGTKIFIIVRDYNNLTKIRSSTEKNGRMRRLFRSLQIERGKPHR
ncbi:MAG TPA: hypothetical protein EYN91_14935 [Candidatus Melainabacteria bacterium]|nr:hypothetical protein [Candidatus Melainabacteria bacterium]